jgi:fumarylacetoacetate (FAA) hydrolase
VKIVSYQGKDGPRVGAVRDGRIYSIAGLLGDPNPIPDVSALLAAQEDVLGALRTRLAMADISASDAGSTDLGSAKLLPPIHRPPTIRDHIAFEEHATRQFTRPVPEVWGRRPIHYYSNTSRILGHGAAVTMPETERLDYELELAVVIRDECSNLSPDNALEHVFGFVIMNDWSARDLQADEMAYGLGPAKGKDFATSLGPWIVTRDEMLPYLKKGVLDVNCEVRVNGEVWASSNASSQAHTWGQMLAHASQDNTLLPGDVIASGTVGGCSIGEAIRKGYPARYLQPGDLVELDVEGIGTLANTIAGPVTVPGQNKYRAAALPPMPEPLTSTGPATA